MAANLYPLKGDFMNTQDHVRLCVQAGITPAEILRGLDGTQTKTQVAARLELWKSLVAFLANQKAPPLPKKPTPVVPVMPDVGAFSAKKRPTVVRGTVVRKAVSGGAGMVAAKEVVAEREVRAHFQERSRGWKRERGLGVF